MEESAEVGIIVQSRLGHMHKWPALALRRFQMIHP